MIGPGPGRGALAALLSRVDGGARPSAAPPSPREDGTRIRCGSWDLRTFIAVPGPGAPFRYLNLNVVHGLTGLPFDRPEAFAGRPGEAFDLQVCLEGRDRAALYKRYHRLGGDARHTPGAVRTSVDGRLELEGRWPALAIRFRDPAQALELQVAFEASGGAEWWANAPPLYAHYTTFGAARVALSVRGERTETETPALHDHGFGLRLPRSLSPLRLFRYEVLRLPDGGQAVATWTEGPRRLTLRSAGVVRSAEGALSPAAFDFRLVRAERFPNHRGDGRHVPAAWEASVVTEGGALRYRAERTSEPRAVLGDGFLHAFAYEASGTGCFPATMAGEGYAETMGAAWASARPPPDASAGVPR